MPRGLPTPDHLSHHVNTHFIYTVQASPRPRHARDRPPSSPARKLIHANPAARCDAGWKDGETGPYDVGNMRMHSRFPNSGLEVGVETCFHWHLLFFAYYLSYIKRFALPETCVSCILDCSWCQLLSCYFILEADGRFEKTTRPIRRYVAFCC